MPTKAKAPAVAAKPAPTQRKSRRVFPVGQCHWRAGGLGDKTGPSACKKAIVAKRANLCPEHEKVWQAAARKRYAANQSAKAAPKSTSTRGKTELEEQLEASVAAFATPQLAAKAAADRVARRARRA